MRCALSLSRDRILMVVLLAVVGCATPHAARSDPELALTDLGGKTRRLSEFRGRVVLLDFWATWCEPCKVSLPVYNAWQLEQGDEGLTVLAASVDDETARARVEEFIRRHAPDVLALRDPDGVAASLLGLSVMPTAYLFDRDGHLVAAHQGVRSDDLEALRVEIARLLLASGLPAPATELPAHGRGVDP